MVLFGGLVGFTVELLPGLVEFAALLGGAGRAEAEARGYNVGPLGGHQLVPERLVVAGQCASPGREVEAEGDLEAAALRQSHEDAKQFHDEAVGRLQAEYTRIQGAHRRQTCSSPTRAAEWDSKKSRAL